MNICTVCLEEYQSDYGVSFCCDVCDQCGFCDFCAYPENHDCWPHAPGTVGSQIDDL